MGKVFALKVWPWPSPTWWITGTNKPKATKDQSRFDMLGDPDAKKPEFEAFVAFDMALSRDEWQDQPQFRQEVFSLHILV